MHAWRAARHDNNKFVPCSYVALHTMYCFQWMEASAQFAKKTTRVRPALFVAKRHLLSTAERNVQVFKALRPLCMCWRTQRDSEHSSHVHEHQVTMSADMNELKTNRWALRHSEFLREDWLNVLRTKLNCKWKQNNTCYEDMQGLYNAFKIDALYFVANLVYNQTVI